MLRARPLSLRALTRSLPALTALVVVATLTQPATAVITVDDVTTEFFATPGSMGAIPDGTGGSCATAVATASRDVAIPVTGVSTRISGVQVNMTLTHAFVGDLTATLVAPGGSPSFTLFTNTGRVGSDCGDSSDLDGPISFSDAANNEWWPIAVGIDGSTAMFSTGYRTSNSVGASTTMTSTFALLGAAANGTWTLRLADRNLGDAGTVSGVSLKLTTTVAPRTSIGSGPANGSRLRSTPVYTFGSPDTNVVGYECQVDTRPYGACSSPYSPPVQPGRHAFRVRAVDSEDDRDVTPAVRTFVLRDLPCEAATAKVVAARKSLAKAKQTHDQAKIAKAKRKLAAAKAAQRREC